jgi:hypothetical protein
MRLIEVTIAGTEFKYQVNPINVVLVRQKWEGVQKHVNECDLGTTCSLLNTGGTSICEWGQGAEFAEILFTNTAGQQSSILTAEPMEKVTKLLNDALRNW